MTGNTAARRQIVTRLGRSRPFGSRIAGWDPVDLAMGLRWLQATIYEGFLVTHRITADDSDAIVWFKRWESGDPEPDWPDGIAC